MVELHLAALFVMGCRRRIGGVGHAGGNVQQIGHTVGAGQRLGDGDDEVCHLHQLHQNLAHIVHQSHHLALGQAAQVHPHCAGVQQRDDGQVNNKGGNGVGQAGDAAHLLLQAVQGLHRSGKAAALRVLPAEGPDDPNAGEVFPGNAGHAVQLRLRLFIKRHGERHNAEHHQAQKRNGRRKDQRGLPVNGEGHHHGAKHHKGAAQQQAQGHIDAVLHLVHVAGHAGDEGGWADLVLRREIQRLDVGKQGVAQPGGKAHGRFCRKVLGRDAAGQADDRQQHQQAAHAQDVANVLLADAGVDNRRHHQRHKQLERGLQHLKQRGQHRLAAIALAVFEQAFQGCIPPFFVQFRGAVLGEGRGGSERGHRPFCVPWGGQNARGEIPFRRVS